MDVLKRIAKECHGSHGKRIFGQNIRSQREACPLLFTAVVPTFYDTFPSLPIEIY